MQNNDEIILTKEKKKKVKLSKEEKKKIREDKKRMKKENPENHYKVRRLFFGIGKEFLRITWLKKHKMLYYFLIVMFVIIVFAIIFSALTLVVNEFINFK